MRNKAGAYVAFAVRFEPSKIEVEVDSARSTLDGEADIVEAGDLSTGVILQVTRSSTSTVRFMF